MSVESILTQMTNETTQTAETTLESTGLDQDAFLQLLLTEIEYQDPLDPMDSTEYVSQLAELSSLEQLTAIEESMADVVSSVEEATSVSALSYLGTEVEAEGSSVSLEDGQASAVTYTLSEDATEVYINIYDADGNIVDTVTPGEQEAGEYTYQWRGQDYDGETQSDGLYSIYIYSEDSDGELSLASTSVAGTVTGVEQSSSGVVLTLDDGRTVNMADVTNVSAG